MSKELREDALLLLANANEGSAGERVALACLAEHPADDDLPLTIEEAEQLWSQAVVLDPNSAWTVSQRSGKLGIHIDCWIPLSTRRDARRLLKASGGTGG